MNLLIEFHLIMLISRRRRDQRAARQRERKSKNRPIKSGSYFDESWGFCSCTSTTETRELLYTEMFRADRRHRVFLPLIRNFFFVPPLCLYAIRSGTLLSNIWFRKCECSPFSVSDFPVSRRMSFLRLGGALVLPHPDVKHSNSSLIEFESFR